jgi:beta-galactosidase
MEETDVLADGQTQEIHALPGAFPGLPALSTARDYCDVIHPEGAQVLATYARDFYAGSAALTRHSFGKGHAYYIASRNDQPFTDALLSTLIAQAGLRRVLDTDLPEGLSVQSRTDGVDEYIFLMNFKPEPQQVALNAPCRDMLSGEPLSATVELPPYGVIVARRPCQV